MSVNRLRDAILEPKTPNLWDRFCDKTTRDDLARNIEQLKLRTWNEDLEEWTDTEFGARCRESLELEFGVTLKNGEWMLGFRRLPCGSPLEWRTRAGWVPVRFEVDAGSPALVVDSLVITSSRHDGELPALVRGLCRLCDGTGIFRLGMFADVCGECMGVL